MTFIANRERARLLARLRAAGVSLPAATESPHRDSVRIRQANDYLDNRLFGLKSGATAFSARVEIATEVRLQVREFRLEVPWYGAELELLEDPGPGRSSVYRFPERDPWKLPRKRVLNHCTGVWPRGTVREGLIVAYTRGPIPPEFIQPTVAVELVITDVWDHVYKQALQVFPDGVRNYFQKPKFNPNPQKRIFGPNWQAEVDAELAKRETAVDNAAKSEPQPPVPAKPQAPVPAKPPGPSAMQLAALAMAIKRQSAAMDQLAEFRRRMAQWKNREDEREPRQSPR